MRTLGSRTITSAEVGSVVAGPLGEGAGGMAGDAFRSSQLVPLAGVISIQQSRGGNGSDVDLMDGGGRRIPVRGANHCFGPDRVASVLDSRRVVVEPGHHHNAPHSGLRSGYGEPTAGAAPRTGTPGPRLTARPPARQARRDHQGPRRHHRENLRSRGGGSSSRSCQSISARNRVVVCSKVIGSNSRRYGSARSRWCCHSARRAARRGPAKP